MKLLSINVSPPKEIIHKGKVVRTGIFKEPVEGRIRVNKLNLEGDGQADLIAHGGEYKAVYVYSYDYYVYWEKELNRDDFSYGQFGENFTVQGMLDDEVHIGDRFKIGTAKFEVTQPRVPCYKLAIRMGVEGFYNQFLQGDRIGFYLRVIEEGELSTEDPIEKIYEEPSAMSISQLVNLMYFDKDNYDAIKEAIKIDALPPGWVNSFEDRLVKAELSGKAQNKYRTLRVSKKIPESQNITSFYLVPEDDEPLCPYLPGQFLPLKLDISGQYKPVFRTYSISDSPNKGYYRLTIKREPAPPDRPDIYPGVSSTYFHDDVNEGTILFAQNPRGKFYLDPELDSPVVLLSAGVGLTPLVSMLHSIVESGSKRQTWFIHGTRNSSEHALADEILKIAEENENVHVHFVYSSPVNTDTLGKDYNSSGHVDMNLLNNLLPDNKAEYYLCGPAPFMKSLFNGLLDWGIPEYNINYEFFGPASQISDRARVSTAKHAADTTDCSGEIEVEFSKSGIKTNWNDSLESILDLAEASGLSPDYSCRSGVCHTCMCKLSAGEVEYFEEPLDPPDEGHVLICVSKPKGNIIVDV